MPDKLSPMIINSDVLAKLINPDSIGLTDSKAIEICVLCNGPAFHFSDALSVKEYRISGMCQVCQDKTFGGDE